MSTPLKLLLFVFFLSPFFLRLFLLFVCFSSFSLSRPTYADLSLKESARQDLSRVLEKYHSQMTKMKVSQEIFLSPLQLQMKSSGFLSLHEKKFLLQLKGQPSLFILFDGEFLWYQADQKEKVVFKIKSAYPSQILSHFFDTNSLFENFQMEEVRKTNSGYILQLSPKRKMEKLQFIFVKWSSYISEIRMTWKDLNNWQKYSLSKPTPQSFPSDYFQFDTSHFQVISKEEVFSSP